MISSQNLKIYPYLLFKSKESFQHLVVLKIYKYVPYDELQPLKFSHKLL